MLELGSGVGFVGMMMAANLESLSIMLCTEQAQGGALDWLNHNISLNTHLPLHALQTCVCDWSVFEKETEYGRPDIAGIELGSNADVQRTGPPTCCPEHLATSKEDSLDRTIPFDVRAAGPSIVSTTPGANCNATCVHDADDTVGVRILQEGQATASTPAVALSSFPADKLRSSKWDLIVGSDLIYSDEGCRLLPLVFSQLAGSETTILYCHTKRRFEHMDHDFLDFVVQAGLHYEEVAEPWAASPQASPEPFVTLFPDMRIVVYKITKKV